MGGRSVANPSQAFWGGECFSETLRWSAAYKVVKQGAGNKLFFFVFFLSVVPFTVKCLLFLIQCAAVRSWFGPVFRSPDGTHSVPPPARVAETRQPRQSMHFQRLSEVLEQISSPPGTSLPRSFSNHFKRQLILYLPTESIQPVPWIINEIQT